MKSISIDIETYSSVDLSKSGVYKYAESEDFEVLLFSYAVDDGDVKTIDLAQGEIIPSDIIEAMIDEKVIKWAFNSQFERVCLSRYLSDKGHLLNPFIDNHSLSNSLSRYLSPQSWKCTMIWSAMLGLPMSLDGVGKVLGLEKKKLDEGKTLIKYFSMPCKPTKSNGNRSRNFFYHDLEKWKAFISYNIRDVEVEIEIKRKLSKLPIQDRFWDEFYLDQEINDRGILIDPAFVKSAISINEKVKEELISELKEITQLENPNSVIQMREWLKDEGLEMDSLGKKEVSKAIGKINGKLERVLKLRQKISKSSVKKYTAMMIASCLDYRERGMFRFYGANRTGRFAGRLVQLQNLPQNHLNDLEEVRALVKQDNLEALELIYDDIPDVLSQLIRTSFVPSKGKKFIVADFAAIEARVLAWLAGEDWRMKVFEQGKDIYCSSASKMFQVPVEKHGVNAHLRQKGKIAELALGYGGSVGALKAMGAIDMGIREEELKPLVDAWRNSNENIIGLWWSVDRAVKECIKQRTTTQTHGIKFSYKSGFLFITLPSGRRLSYVKPRIGENQFGGESVTYEGVGSTKKWERIESYGPKFVENIIQAISRDLLVYAMLQLRCCNIVAHVHDEIIIEAQKEMSVEEICKQMAKTPSWAKDLILRADGYECDFYKKD